MSSQNKEMIDNSFEEFEDLDCQGFIGRKTQVSDLYDEFSNSSKKLPNSVQEFLLQSDRIQEDIRKLKINSTDKADLYKNINEKMKELGYKFEITANCKLNTVTEVLDEILNDFVDVSRKFEENGRILDEYEENNKKNEREKKNKKIFKKFEFGSVASNLEDLFKEITNRDFNMKNDADHNIMSFIKYTEVQREKLIKRIQDFNTDKQSLQESLQDLEYKNKDLLTKLKKSQTSSENSEKIKISDQVCNDVSLQSIKDLPDAIFKFQQVMFTLPTIEKFISDLSEEYSDQNCKTLEEILGKIKSQKKLLAESDDFRRKICQAFGSEKLKEIGNYGRGLSHFCKLFEVSNSEKLLSVVEELFYFVHQIKGFLSVIFIQYFRRKLGMNDSAKIKEILENIINLFEKKY